MKDCRKYWKGKSSKQSDVQSEEDSDIELDDVDIENASKNDSTTTNAKKIKKTNSITNTKIYKSKVHKRGANVIGRNHDNQPPTKKQRVTKTFSKLRHIETYTAKSYRGAPLQSPPKSNASATSTQQSKKGRKKPMNKAKTKQPKTKQAAPNTAIDLKNLGWDELIKSDFGLDTTNQTQAFKFAADAIKIGVKSFRKADVRTYCNQMEAEWRQNLFIRGKNIFYKKGIINNNGSYAVIHWKDPFGMIHLYSIYILFSM